jgi:hypothetical protein
MIPEIHLLTSDPELMTDRVNTTDAIMAVVGPIAEEHGLAEALSCAYVAVAQMEHVAGLTAEQARKGIASARAVTKRVRKRIGEDASAREMMIELHVAEDGL